ncbi:hypothetical protein KL905_004017 [Ogataea polymorpha]|uniref:Uncharacterized protein n=2 Tax=Ogataea polymorpha TaxID=460523 RepID=A0A9P8NTW8_9ASCO|nr:hypothetical protein KL937_003884 [Ogataea polymorpha]KAG7890585.1 hypothetical protein KL908_004422 [Ogataea polymorpha]KAG7898848.1 hypothetical protein KL935_003856 [Ogataea polymorpha]KAG7903845.1 hypothetical protein KL907_003872 [Ogataea polymorpha]KAG7907458.1 hypothetical protein KL906_004145 [Ogataea polymorpha]
MNWKSRGFIRVCTTIRRHPVRIRQYSHTQVGNATHTEDFNELLPKLKNMISHLPKKSLPYYKQLVAFDECTSQNCTYDSRTGKVIGGLEAFWQSIHKIMPLYDNLVHTGELKEDRMDSLISLLRNGLRIHRYELAKQKKNLDKDLDHSLKSTKTYLTESLRKVTNEILKYPTLQVSPAGISNIFKAYKDLGFVEEAVQFWEQGKTNNRLKPIFDSEPVLGSVIHFLVDTGDFDLQEVKDLYDHIKSKKAKLNKGKSDIHPELVVGMIKACLVKGEIDVAGELFQQITSDVCKECENLNRTPSPKTLSYMTNAHLSFIAYSSDIATSNMFFESAANGQLPYPTPLQVNYIKPYMMNLWQSTYDLHSVQKVWERTWKHNEIHHRSNASMSSSLNDLFFKIFFSRYPHCTPDGVKHLKQVIEAYSNVRSMDEPFFNCLLTNASAWNNTEVFHTIVKAADLYNFPKTNVFYRCCLKASGSVNLKAPEIINLVQRLFSANVSMGYRKIANADWLAIRDATINSKIVSEEKVDLYFKLWKKCSPYFATPSNYYSYQREDTKLNAAYSHIFNNIRKIDAEEITLNQLDFFVKDHQISLKVN